MKWSTGCQPFFNCASALHGIGDHELLAYREILSGTEVTGFHQADLLTSSRPVFGTSAFKAREEPVELPEQVLCLWLAVDRRPTDEYPQSVVSAMTKERR